MLTADPQPSPLQQIDRRTIGGAGWHAIAGQLGLQPEEADAVRQLLEGPIDYIDDPLFHQPDAEQALFEESESLPRPSITWYNPMVLEIRGEASNNVDSKVLTAKQERLLFRQFNYSRRRAEQARRQIDPAQPDIEKIREMINWHRRAMTLRERIAEYNLALVLAMIKRVRSSGLEFSELLSEGNLALLRAIDKFNADRGFKFSTYACRAILKAFSRYGTKTTRRRNLFPVEFDPQLERSDYSERRADEFENDCAGEVRRIVDSNEAELSDVEDTVIRRRFALGDASERPMTLEEVGRLVGFTKERVRQIQNRALQKIRHTLESGYLDGPAQQEESADESSP
jgi:RNA polymerase sigma factor (sigma-70 family)